VRNGFETGKIHYEGHFYAVRNDFEISQKSELFGICSQPFVKTKCSGHISIFLKLYRQIHKKRLKIVKFARGPFSFLKKHVPHSARTPDIEKRKGSILFSL
jgi:hypothetical protein